MTIPAIRIGFAALLLGGAGMATAAVAQNATFPPGTNCMMLSSSQRPACLAQSGQQGSVPRTTTVAPNGAANAQNPTSANSSVLTGPSATVAPDTTGPSSTVAPNTAGPSTTVTPNSGSSVNSSQTVLPNTNPNAVTTPGTIVSPNAVTTPGTTVSPNSVTMPNTTGTTVTGPTTPTVVPNGASTTGTAIPIITPNGTTMAPVGGSATGSATGSVGGSAGGSAGN